MSYHNDHSHSGSPCPCEDQTIGCGKSRPLGALLLPATVSTNPASMTETPTSATTYAVIGVLGVAGFLLYRHFKKSGSSSSGTP